MTDDFQAILAEAQAKKVQQDGAKLTLNGRSFTLWPSRFEYQQRLELGQITGFTPSSLLMTFASGDVNGSIEAFAAFVAMSMYQTGSTRKEINMNHIVAYVEQTLYEGDPDSFEVEILRPDDGINKPEEGITLTPADSPDAGPNGSGQ